MPRKNLRSPIRWLGGKGLIKKKILPLIPYDKIYVEPFGGGASILLAREPSSVEVYNDLFGGLHDLFLVISKPDLFEKFYRRVALMPYSRRFYDEYKNSWIDEKDLIERAVKFFFIARQSFGGILESSCGSVVAHSRRGMAETASGWLSAIAMLPEIHARLQRVQVENADWMVILDRYDTYETVFYIDPPYVTSTRRGGVYENELNDTDHVELVDALLELKGAAVLSGYKNEIYKRLEDGGWARTDFDVACHAAGRTRNSGLQGKGSVSLKQKRTESVWQNPKAYAMLNKQLELKAASV
jgi:DNA adenine methylase